MKKNVLITGGTGFIGKQLTKMLLERNYSVSILTRTIIPNTGGITYYSWDVSNEYIDETAVLNADYIIHLAGENIAKKRWTPKRKKEILDSRIQSIQLIYSVLKKHNKKIEAFVSASGIGIYGSINGTEICNENTQPSNDFIGLVCQEWEKQAESIVSLGIRTVKIRTGLVLGKNDGFLSKLTPIFKRKLGAVLGSGKQYMPWIYIDDLVKIYIEVIENANVSGAYNATIDDGTTNLSFSKELAKHYKYSIWLPNVPSFFMRLLMGEMSCIVLTGRRVSSDKIKKTGFLFEYNNLEKVLKKCLD